MTQPEDQGAPPAVRSPFPKREFAFTLADFRTIAAVLHEEAGIALPEIKAPLVYSRLVKRLRLLGLESFEDYCARIRSERSEERSHMVAALTTNVTRFFREMHHFEHLKTTVLPGLLKAAREGARVRFWSAGCSSGEEPYSLALTILSIMPDAPRFDIKILATDIDDDILERARAGIYLDDATGAIAAQHRQRWLKRQSAPEDASAWSIGDDARALVAFRKLNLLGSWPMKGKFQVVFCRNVAIYFEEATRLELWPRFASVIVPGGHLYVGHSERVTGNHLFRVTGLTTYQLGNPNPDHLSSEGGH